MYSRYCLHARGKNAYFFIREVLKKLTEFLHYLLCATKAVFSAPPLLLRRSPDDIAGSYVYKTADNGKSFVKMSYADIRDHINPRPEMERGLFV